MLKDRFLTNLRYSQSGQKAGVFRGSLMKDGLAMKSFLTVSLEKVDAGLKLALYP